jgi:Zn-dependent protease
MRDPLEGMRRVDPAYLSSKGKIRFSKTEILHISAAIVVLSVAFFLVFRNSVFDSDPITNYLIIFGMSVLLVVCSFLFHEFGHKFVAQKYNAWSEFRVFPYGLVMALVFAALVGILFAAPGAVYIQGNINKDDYGKISLAGPAVNFTISAIAIVMCLVFEPGSLAFAIIFMLAMLNAFMGLFNMIPILPFDGAKIVAWSIPVYIMVLAIGIAEFAFVWFYLQPLMM